MTRRPFTTMDMMEGLSIVIQKCMTCLLTNSTISWKKKKKTSVGEYEPCCVNSWELTVRNEREFHLNLRIIPLGALRYILSLPLCFFSVIAALGVLFNSQLIPLLLFKDFKQNISDFQQMVKAKT